VGQCKQLDVETYSERGTAGARDGGGRPGEGEGKQKAVG